MRAIGIRLSDYDTRYFQVEDGYRYGHYHELDKPQPQNTRLTLCVYRVPQGMRAPLGRIPDEMLALLADEAAKPEAPPEVLARFRFWSYIEDNGRPIELPEGATCEPLRILPSSALDKRSGFYIEPPDSLTPLPTRKAAAVAEKTDAKAATAKEG